NMRMNSSENARPGLPVAAAGMIPAAVEGELFTPRDLRQMAEMDLSPREAARHVELFRNPPPFTRVLRPCRPGDGIRSLTLAEHADLLSHFDAAARRGRVAKLVPASGAATRMFNDLLAFLAAPAGTEPTPAVRTFFANLHRFAFYEDLAASLGTRGIDLDEAVANGDWRVVLSPLLDAP